MKKLVVMGIKIFFLLFFSYINKNFSCDCCDECWEKFFPDKKHSSKDSDKTKKNNSLSIIEEENKSEEENKPEEEENKPEEEENKREEENKQEEEENKPEEEEKKV